MTLQKLTAINVKSRLDETEGWSLTPDGAITRTIKLADFKEALLFVNALGLLAEAANHHPDIDIRWNKVKLTLLTHEVGSLTDKDFNLAAKINKLPVPSS